MTVICVVLSPRAIPAARKEFPPIVSVCLYEIARPRRRRFETSLIEGIDYTVEQEETEK